MIKINCIGYPRIGPKRELKNALEKYWKSEISEGDLLKCASELKKNNWQTQKDNGVDFICSNDFSFYDQVHFVLSFFRLVDFYKQHMLIHIYLEYKNEIR